MARRSPSRNYPANFLAALFLRLGRRVDDKRHHVGGWHTDGAPTLLAFKWVWNRYREGIVKDELRDFE